MDNRLQKGLPFSTERPVRLEVNTLPQITSTQAVDILGASVLIQNSGDDTAYIDKNLTLPPGASLTLGGSADWNYIQCRILISFEGTGTSPLVEIMELRASLQGYGQIPY